MGPARKLPVQILSCIGESGEDDELAVTGIERLMALALDHLAQGRELGVPRDTYLLRRREQRR